MKKVILFFVMGISAITTFSQPIRIYDNVSAVKIIGGKKEKIKDTHIAITWANNDGTDIDNILFFRYEFGNIQPTSPFTYENTTEEGYYTFSFTALDEKNNEVQCSLVKVTETKLMLFIFYGNKKEYDFLIDLYNTKNIEHND